MKIPILRTCDALGRGAGGFQYPREGFVWDPNWNPRPLTGNGIHGLAWGQGNACQFSPDPNAVWLVLLADPADIVDLGDKVKTRGGEVVYYGDRAGAIRCLAGRGAGGPDRPLPFHRVVAGDEGAAVTGLRGTSIAGELGHAVSGDEGVSVAALLGRAQSGLRGTSVVGVGGLASAGVGGLLRFLYQGDDGSLQFHSVEVDGTRVLANTPYRFDEHQGVAVRCP